MLFRNLFLIVGGACNCNKSRSGALISLASAGEFVDGPPLRSKNVRCAAKILDKKDSPNHLLENTERWTSRILAK